MPAYAELELELSGQGEEQYQLRFRFSPPDGSADTNLGLDQPAPVRLDLARLLALRGDPQAYGTCLTQRVFASPAAAAAFAQARSLSEAAGAPLRLRLLFHAEQLHDLLWETLLDPNRGTPLGMDETVLLSRFILSARACASEVPEVDRMRLLALIASPRNMQARLAPIDAPAELERIRRALPYMQVSALAGGGQATRLNLLSQLGGGVRGCDALYLVAHGLIGRDGPAVLLEKAGGGELVSAKRLAADLASLRELPLLAVLVSCQSAGDGARGNALLTLGPLLAQVGVPAVLAMHGSVTFPTMERFIPAFFAELLRDGEIDRALAAARRQVSDRPDWWMPVLFCRLRGSQILRPPALALPFQRAPFEPETAYIPSGPFQMGRDPGPGVPPWETPCHTVDLDGFRIGRYPVTNAEFAEYVRQAGAAVEPLGWSGLVPRPNRLKEPVTGVSWEQAVDYCRWLSEVTGRSYTLPNEAQWERAARGPRGRLYPWGDEWQSQRCSTEMTRTAPVDAYPPQNEAGLFDLVGNAREWTLTQWGPLPGEPDARYAYPYHEDGRNDPRAGKLIRRVCRGGAMASPAEMTCTARAGLLRDKNRSIEGCPGFRVVMNQAQKEK